MCDTFKEQQEGECGWNRDRKEGEKGDRLVGNVSGGQGAGLDLEGLVSHCEDGL